MNEWQRLLTQINELQTSQVKRPPALKYPGVSSESAEQPSVFVRLFLAAAVVMVVIFALTVAYFWVFAPARPIPDYRRYVKYTAYKSTSITTPADDDSKILVSSDGNGVEPFESQMLWWADAVTVESTHKMLPTNSVDGLSVSGEQGAFTCVDDSRKCLTFGNAKNGTQFWPQPFLDKSHMGSGTGDTLSCVELAGDPGRVLVGSAGDGIGIYERSTRRWLDPINAASGKISDDHIHDLRRTGVGMLVANDKGIDVCDETGSTLQLKHSIRGLASNGVQHLYPASGVNDSSGLDLWFTSVGHGLGAVMLSEDGVEQSRKVLVSERSVPGLTEKVCTDAVFNDSTNLLWVAFKQGGGMGVARYDQSKHDWLGTQSALSLASQPMCIGAFDESALVGTDNGVWEATERNDQLNSIYRGLANEKVSEIAGCEGGPIAHSISAQGPGGAGESATRIRWMPMFQYGGRADWNWTDLIGPKRFADLKDQTTITCAANVPGTQTFVFGTQGLGIGEYQADSHEISQLFPAKADKPGEQSAEATVKDIACGSLEDILAVTGDHSLSYYDGRVWTPLISSAGIKATPENVTTAITKSDNKLANSGITIAADPVVADYDMQTHTWKQLANLPGVQRMTYTGDRLWALSSEDSKSTLWMYDNSAWADRVSDVFAMSSGSGYVDVLVGASNEVKSLQVFDSTDSKPAVLSPKPLENDSRNATWTTASSEGSQLYLGSSATTCQYNLDSHEWKSLGLPGNAGTPSALEAMKSGLWMLDSNGSLFFHEATTGNWRTDPVETGVNKITGVDDQLLVLRKEGDAQGPLLSLRSPDSSTVLVGSPLVGDLSTTTLAADLDGMLFIGSSQSINRYDDQRHSWTNHKIPDGESLVDLSPAADKMYALTKINNRSDGRAYSYSKGAAAFEAIVDPETNANLEATLLTTEGSFAALAAVRPTDSDVLLTANGNQLSSVYPSSSVNLGNRKIDCSAENNAELFLGCDDGTILDYRDSNSGQSHWVAYNDTADGSPVRKIEVMGNDSRFVIRDHSIKLQTRGQGTDWTTDPSLFKDDISDCDGWRVNESNQLLCGGKITDPDKLAGCFSVLELAAPVQGQQGTPIVGSGLVSSSKNSPTVSVAELGANGITQLFRADSDGNLGRYDEEAHAWTKESIVNIARVMSSMGGMWAFAPKDSALYSLQGGAWNKSGKPNQDQFADVDSSADHLVVRYTDGRVNAIDSGGAAIGPQLAGPAPDVLKTGVSDLRSIIEVDGTLICATADRVVVYDMPNHRWRQVYDGGVRQMLRIGTQIYAIPAAQGKNVLRFAAKDNAAAFAPTADLPSGPVRLLAIDNLLGVSTVDGGLYVAAKDNPDAWTPLVDEAGRLSGGVWPQIACVCEANKFIVLGLADASGTLLRWDQINNGWLSVTLNHGTTERLIPFGNGILAVCVEPGQPETLVFWDLLKSTADVIGDARNFRNIFSFEDEVWCVQSDGGVYQLGADLKLKPFKTVSATKPTGIKIVDMKAIGDDLVATWSDGSIWHHGVNASGWRLVQDKPSDASASFKRHLYQFAGHIISADPDGNLVVYDPAADKYVHTDTIPNAAPQDAKPSQWEVVDLTQVRLGESKMAIAVNSDGQLSNDDVQEVAADRNSIYCLTAARLVRVFDRNSRDEVKTITADAAQQLFKQPSALEFTGQIYTAAADDGPWATSQPGVKLRITQNLAGHVVQFIPYSVKEQHGLTQQWVSNPSFDGHGLAADIPGARLEGMIADGPKLVVENIFDAPNQAAAVITDGSGDLASNSTLGPQWSLGSKGNGGYPLVLKSADGKFNQVSLDEHGFGFDQVAAMSIKDETISLFTRDGLVSYNLKQQTAVPASIDASMAVTSDMLGKTWQVLEGLPAGLFVLISPDHATAMGTNGQTWASVNSDNLNQQLRSGNLLLLDGKFAKWSYFDNVTLIGQNTNTSTQFIPETGRLAIDQVYSIGAGDGKAWAITASGLCSLHQNGPTEIISSDPAYDWSKGGKFLSITDQGETSLYVRLTTKSNKNKVLKWSSTRWVPLSDADADAVLKSSTDQLLNGKVWRVKDSDINRTADRSLGRHWGWNPNGVFSDVRFVGTESDARLDYEHINGIAAFDDKLWIATDGGVMRVDMASRQLVNRSLPGNSRVVSDIHAFTDAKNKRQLIASVDGSDFVLSEIAGNDVWQPASNIRALPYLVNTSRWQIQRGASQLVIRHTFDGDTMEAVQLQTVADGMSRFDFDAISSVAGQAQQLAMVTGKGLIERSMNAGDSDVHLSGLNAANAEVFCNGPKDMRKLIYGNSSALYERVTGGNVWALLNSENADNERAEQKETLAWSDIWKVKNESSGLIFAMKLPKDTDYKPARFLSEVGMFAFDRLNDVLAINENEEMLLATDDGIVEANPDGLSWSRRYSDPKSNNNFSHLAGRGADVMASRDDAGGRPIALYKIDVNQGSCMEQPAGDAEKDQFFKKRFTLFDQNDGWRGLDVASYRQSSNTTDSRGTKLSLSWKSQPVWLVKVGDQLCFAHDIIYSVARAEGAIWLGTAGGNVNYSLSGSDSGGAKLDDPDIHASELMSEAYDPWAPGDPPKVDLIRSSRNGSAYAYIFQGNDQSPIIFSKEYSSPQFAQLQADSSDYQRAITQLTVEDEPLWSWQFKNSGGFTISFHKGRADLPEGYSMLSDGTFRFFDTTYSADRKTRERTIQICGKQVFLATHGGIICFDSEKLQAIKLFAAAGSWPIQDVRQFYFDRRNARLYARSGDGTVFSLDLTAPDAHFAVYTSQSNAFKDADIVVDNDLLQWRQQSDGAKLALANSDLPRDAPYCYFDNGKFSFDYVNALAFAGQKVLAATAGGVVELDRKTHAILKIHARDFPIDQFENDPDRRFLRNVNEIIVDRQGDGSTYARNAMRQSFRFDGTSWSAKPPSDVDAPFRREYTRVSQPFWDWMQPPSGIYVELHQSFPGDLVIGLADPTASTALMSNGRLAWDDLREAALYYCPPKEGQDEASSYPNQLLLATPAGICVYRYNFSRGTADCNGLYWQASAPSGKPVAMTNLQRIEREVNGDMIAWNSDTVYHGHFDQNANPPWHWSVTPIPLTSIYTSKNFREGDNEQWNLQTSDGGKQLKVTFINSKGSKLEREITLGQPVTDLTRAILTRNGIWLLAGSETLGVQTHTPIGAGNGGVIWLDKDLFRLQTQWSFVGYAVPMAALFGLGVFLRVLKRHGTRESAALKSA